MKTFRAHVVGNLSDAELNAKDPVLPAGHVAMASDIPASFRVGDGVTPYTQLERFTGNSGTPPEIVP